MLRDAGPRLMDYPKLSEGKIKRKVKRKRRNKSRAKSTLVLDM